MDERTQEQIDHNWQAHRIRCLELAIAAGARVDNVIEVADTLGSYILTRCAVEIKNREKPE